MSVWDSGATASMQGLVTSSFTRVCASGSHRPGWEYRNVLILRCLEQLLYAESAGLMDCKESRARVLLFLAKHSLREQSGRWGFSKTLLLIASYRH